MLSQRLSLALKSSAIVLPDDGQIAVIGARADDNLGDLPKNRVEVVQRHFAHHAHFQNAGYAVSTSVGGPYSMSIIALPRAKTEAQQTIARAAQATDGPLIIDGQKNDGIDSVLKAVRQAGEVGDVIAKAHGKMFAVIDADFSNWHDAVPTRIANRFVTAPGVFSADGVDPGSEALAAAIPANFTGRVVDLGAGWGYLSDTILRRDGVTHVDLVEADFVAIEAARQNILDKRAEFHWADARDWRPAGPVDHVVTNPPFHQKRAAEASLGQAFIRSAARILGAKGQLWLVANRHLPYEQTLEDAFHTVQSLGQNSSFKLFHAKSPRRRRIG
ncbi:MAG: class I SAM-dependent methyltransferase [Boseongicola sp.]